MAMTTERAIRLAMFVFLLIGLCAVSAWVSYAYLAGTLILQVAALALSWGIILLVLYVGFEKADWDWWT